MRISRIDCFFAGPDIEQITKHYNDPESFRIQPGNIHSYSNQNEHIPQLMPRHHVKKIGKKDRTCQVAGAALLYLLIFLPKINQITAWFAVFFVTLCVLQDNFKQTVPEMFNHTRKVRRNQYLFMPA